VVEQDFLLTIAREGIQNAVFNDWEE
jgi:hypothetical protein